MSKLSVSFTVTQADIEKIARGEPTFDEYFKRRYAAFLYDVRTLLKPVVKQAVENVKNAQVYNAN